MKSLQNGSPRHRGPGLPQERKGNQASFKFEGQKRSVRVRSQIVEKSPSMGM